MKSLFSILPLAAVTVSQDTPQIPLHPITSPSYILNLDNIPALGYGTWNLKGNTSEAVSWAIQTGYRHIDSAAAYGNEEDVRKGIQDGLSKTGLSREDLWITSKLWNDHHDPQLVEKAIDTSLRKLGLEYLDLYLMHWPVESSAAGRSRISYSSTWDAMTLLVGKGKARHIGISNFSPRFLEVLLAGTTMPPSVHQMELHPYLQQEQWLEFHRNHSIRVTAYSPLGGTNPTYRKSSSSSDAPDPLLQNKVLKKIAKKRGCSAAQVALKWGMSRGTSVIPKSVHKNYIEENFRSVECGLKAKDLKKIDKLGEARQRYSNPSERWGVTLFEGLEDEDGKHGRASWWDE